jgi:hypothetical protein
MLLKNMLHTVEASKADLIITYILVKLPFLNERCKYSETIGDR